MSYDTTERTNKPNKERLRKFLSAENGNILSLLEESDLGNIGANVISEYDLDYNDPRLAKKRRNWVNGQKLVAQEIEEKNTPFENASNVKYPLLTTASIQFGSRAYPEIVQGNTVVKPKIAGSTISVPPEEGQQPTPEQQEEQAELDDKIAKADRVCEFINWQLFNEIEEWEEDTDSLLLMLPLFGTMFRCVYYSHDKKRIVTELYSPEELVMPYKAKSVEDSPRISKEFSLYPKNVRARVRSGRYFLAEDRLNELFDDEDREKPEEFIEQYKWLDLDNDNFKEPYIVTVHRNSGTVLRISPNYRMGDIIVNDDGDVSKISPIKYFTKYIFIPSVDGSIYGMGFYDLLYPINEVINSLTNQLLDAGTLANSNTGFISSGLGLRKKGKLKLQIGEFVTVENDGNDIRQSIYQMQFSGADATLYSLLTFMVDAGRDIANLKEVLEGTQHGETATTTMALIEQGLKVFSAIYKRIHRSLKKELQLIRFWNHEMRNPLYGEVLDERMSQDDFDGDDLDFIPVSDPQVVTDMQKMGKVQFKMQFMNDPYVDQMELRKQLFEGAKVDGWEQLRAGQDPQMQELQQKLQQMQQVIEQLTEANKDLQQTKDFEQMMSKAKQKLEMLKEDRASKLAMLKEDRAAIVDEANVVNTEVDSFKKLTEAKAQAKEAQIALQSVVDEVKALEDGIKNAGAPGAPGAASPDMGGDFAFNPETGTIDAV